MVGGITNEGSPSNEDCIDAGSEMGELVLRELAQPIEVCTICWLVETPDTVEIGSGRVFTELVGVPSVRNFPNTSCNKFHAVSKL